MPLVGAAWPEGMTKSGLNQSKISQHFPEGLAPVADAVFFFRRDLCAGLAVLRKVEKGVLAKPVFAGDGVTDPAFHGPSHNTGFSIGQDSSDSCDEAGTAFLVRDIFQ